MASPWRRQGSESTTPNEFTIGPYVQSGILLAKFHSNHPAFVAAAVELKLRNTPQRSVYTGLVEERTVSDQGVFQRALDEQNQLDRRQVFGRGRRPIGFLALMNNTARGDLQPLGYGYAYRYSEWGDHYATEIGNIIVDGQHMGEGIGALIARELIVAGGREWVSDSNNAIRLLPAIDPPATAPEPETVLWEGQPARAPHEVIRDINRAYGDLPPYTVVEGAPQNP